ncbi:MAG: hypothetical protein M3R70_10225 [Actinomycetota bacterium]|nr:hypothetical protein [Actinomycetota bacterium]
MARDPEQELNEARSRYEANDLYGALKRLDHARKAYADRGNTEGLRRVMEFAERADLRDDRARAVRENLVYAVKQNIRGTTRRDALRAKRPWVDPYPDLSAPQEHTRIPITRGLKFWIGAGVAIGALGVLAYIAALIALAIWGDTGDKLGARIHNDTGRAVVVKWCDNYRCDFGSERSKDEIAPGLSAEQTLPAEDLVDLFVIYDGDKRIGCLPVRVHDAWKALDDKQAEVHVSVSQKTRCPGAAVVPTEESPPNL